MGSLKIKRARVLTRNCTTSSRMRCMLVAAGASGLMQNFAAGASATWTFGGDGTWQTASNWTSGGPPNAGGQLAEFASFASTPGGPISISLVSSVTVGSIVFNSGTSVPISLDLSGTINLQVGPASNADGITLNTNSSDVTINGATQSYRFGTNTVGNLNVGANRTLTMNIPLAGSSATRDPARQEMERLSSAHRALEMHRMQYARSK